MPNYGQDCKDRTDTAIDLWVRLDAGALYQNHIFVDDNATGLPAIGNRPAPIPINRYLPR